MLSFGRNRILLVLMAMMFPSAALAKPFWLENRQMLLTIMVSVLIVAMPSALGFGVENVFNPLNNYPTVDRIPPRKRTRKFVYQTFDELGPYYVRRSHRMPQEDFWELHRLIRPYIGGGKRLKKYKGKANEANGAPNGVTPSTLRLSAALRYFSGGDPCDTMVSHGISHAEAFRSAWYIVDAVNRCKELQIKCPTSHREQSKIARGFQRISKADFGFCAGAIDCMLLWIEKPKKTQCEVAKVGRSKFFCGRKKKFGLNLQAVCDSHSRFLDLEIGHPASTADFLAWSTSKIESKVSKEGFLREGLCFFGDNAHVNKPCMCTPWPASGSGVKDDYNFYHSQVRIKIECAFGMLVNRWGILRKPLSSQLSLKKVGALAMCLCRLHNFCITQRLKRQGKEDEDTGGVPANAAKDALAIAAGGGTPLAPSARDPTLNQNSPEQLLHGGQHFENVPQALRRRIERANPDGLPRDIMTDIVGDKGLKRPTPKAWKDVAN